MDSDASLHSEDEHLENASFTANHEFDAIMSDLDGDLAGFENEMPKATQPGSLLSTPVLVQRVQRSEQPPLERDVDHFERAEASVRSIQSQILDEIAIYPGKFIILLGIVALFISFGITSLVSQQSKLATSQEGKFVMAPPSKQLGFHRVKQPAIDKAALYTLIKRLEHDLADVQHRLELAESRIEVLEEGIMKLKTQKYSDGTESKRKGKANDSMLLGANHKMLYAAALGEGVPKKHRGCRDPSHSALMQNKRLHKR